MSLFAVVYGFDYIATVPPTVTLIGERFGRRSVGTIYGWVSFVHMVGGAAAAALAGEIHDRAGDDTAAFYVAGLLGLLAAAMAFGVRQRQQAMLAAGAAA
jgi:MYXO-CTERM domain-containing protein